MSDLLLVEKRELICTLTINRPEVRNSLSPELLVTMGDTLNALKDDPETRVVVIRGAGEKAFSSGYDIGRIEQRSGQADEAQGILEYSFGSIAAYPSPVIAMIYGFAVGAGLELVVSCDLRIAADNARFGIPPAKLGVVYSHTGVQKFVEQVGMIATNELFFSGRLVSAQRALQIGLVNQIVPEEQLASVTYDLAREIAGNAPLSVSGAKTTIAKLTKRQPLSEEDLAELRQLRERAMLSEDLAEGQKAFMEKRKPVFKGR